MGAGGHRFDVMQLCTITSYLSICSVAASQKLDSDHRRLEAGLQENALGDRLPKRLSAEANNDKGEFMLNLT